MKGDVKYHANFHGISVDPVPKSYRIISSFFCRHYVKVLYYATLYFEHYKKKEQRKKSTIL